MLSWTKAELADPRWPSTYRACQRICSLATQIPGPPPAASAVIGVERVVTSNDRHTFVCRQYLDLRLCARFWRSSARPRRTTQLSTCGRSTRRSARRLAHARINARRACGRFSHTFNVVQPHLCKRGCWHVRRIATAPLTLSGEILTKMAAVLNTGACPLWRSKLTLAPMPGLRAIGILGGRSREDTGRRGGTSNGGGGESAPGNIAAAVPHTTREVINPIP